METIIVIILIFLGCCISSLVVLKSVPGPGEIKLKAVTFTSPHTGTLETHDAYDGALVDVMTNLGMKTSYEPNEDGEIIGRLPDISIRNAHLQIVYPLPGTPKQTDPGVVRYMRAEGDVDFQDLRGVLAVQTSTGLAKTRVVVS